MGGKHLPASFPDVQLHIVDAPLGAGPESITTNGGYGFRSRCCASPRNDGLGFVLRFAMTGKNAFHFVHASDASRFRGHLGVVPADAGPHTPCRWFWETLLDDFLANYALWLWV